MSVARAQQRSSAFDERRPIVRKRTRNEEVEITDRFSTALNGRADAILIPRYRIEELLGISDDVLPANRDDALPSTPQIPIDVEQMESCFERIEKGFGAACLDRIDAELTAHGFRYVTSGTKEVDPAKYPETLDEDTLIGIQRDAMRAIMATGMCPVGVRRDENSGRLVPFIPEPGTYAYSYGTVGGVGVVTFYWATVPFASSQLVKENTKANGDRSHQRVETNNQFTRSQLGTPDPRIKVLHGFGFRPTVRGKLKSPVAKFLEEIELKQFFVEQAKRAEVILANPPVMKEHDNAAESRRTASKRIAEYTGDGVSDDFAEGQSKKINNITIRSDEQIAAFEQQQREAANQIHLVATGSPADTYNADQEGTSVSRHPRSQTACDSTGHEMPWRTEYSLPQNYKLVHQTQPRPHQNMLGVMDTTDKLICACLGVPHQLFSADASLKADADTAKDTLDSTTQKWKRIVSEVLTFCVDSTFLQPNVEARLERLFRLKRAANKGAESRLVLQITDDELNKELEDIVSLRVEYRDPPPKPEQLRYMYGRQIIRWKTFAENMARANRLNPALVLPTDAFSEDASRVSDVEGYRFYYQVEQQMKQQEKAQKHQEKLAKIAATSTDTADTSTKKKAAGGDADDDSDADVDDKPKKKKKADD